MAAAIEAETGLGVFLIDLINPSDDLACLARLALFQRVSAIPRSE